MDKVTLNKLVKLCEYYANFENDYAEQSFMAHYIDGKADMAKLVLEMLKKEDNVK